jgi:hypothetical protein
MHEMMSIEYLLDIFYPAQPPLPIPDPRPDKYILLKIDYL